MNADQAKALRDPFPPEVIGKLPKPTKKENTKGRCGECGGWHGLPAVHLDYASHAAVTDRLLKVDPDWTWEPMARGPNGEPLTVDGGLWIYLTVCGVTRPGFGDATGGKGPKEMIGDALRNAAMRFGVGLDLWAKEDLHATPEVDPFEALERELLVLVPDVAESVVEHREKLTRDGHVKWLERCIAAAQAKVRPPSEDEAADEQAGEPQADHGGTPPSPVSTAAVLRGEPSSPAAKTSEGELSTASAGPEPRDSGGSGGPPAPSDPPSEPRVAFPIPAGVPLDPRNSPCVLFDGRTSQARTLKKLDMTVTQGRDEGLFDTLTVHAVAFELAADLVGPASEYVDDTGEVRYSLLRKVLPMWLASQMIDRLEATAEFARLAS